MESPARDDPSELLATRVLGGGGRSSHVITGCTKSPLERRRGAGQGRWSAPRPHSLRAPPNPKSLFTTPRTPRGTTTPLPEVAGNARARGGPAAAQARGQQGALFLHRAERGAIAAQPRVHKQKSSGGFPVSRSAENQRGGGWGGQGRPRDFSSLASAASTPTSARDSPRPGTHPGDSFCIFNGFRTSWQRARLPL